MLWLPRKPTAGGAGRFETCMELVNQAMRCLENNDVECAVKLIVELIKNQCHDGYAVGKEVTDGVRGVVRELWLRNNDEERCELLRMLRDLGISKKWIGVSLRAWGNGLNRWFIKCGIEWGNKARRNNVVKNVESLLREKLGWDEIMMCKELLHFIGIDAEVLRRYGIEPCAWLSGLELLSDLRRPYWLGLQSSDLIIQEIKASTRLMLKTTNTISAIFFPTLLKTVKALSLNITSRGKAPLAKYVYKLFELSFYIDLGVDEWPWPIKLSADEFERMLNGFNDEELAEFVAGIIDGDGTVHYETIHRKNGIQEHRVYVIIVACKKCPKRFILNVLKGVIAKRFGIVGKNYAMRTENALVFYDKDAIKLLRLIRPFVHHPLRRLRIELILAYYDGRISREVFEKFYEMTEYERGGPDVKRNHGLEALARAAPQTHTHGG